MRTEFSSNIVSIRALEDAIRSTRKYTEGIETIRKAHPEVQGSDTPSRLFCKYYEVYPKTELSWDMPAGQAIDLLWHDVPCVDVLFKYDYRINRASMILRDNNGNLKLLLDNIPGFREALATITTAQSAAATTDSKLTPTVRVVKPGPVPALSVHSK